MERDQVLLGRLFSRPEISVIFSGYGFARPAGWQAPRDPQRYRHLFGAPGFDLGAVMAKVGWRFTSSTVRVAAEIAGGRVIGCAWAGMIRYRDLEPRSGINLSYIVDPQWEGCGVMQALVAAAALRLRSLQSAWDLDADEEAWPTAGSANVQCAAVNARSAGVAQALGMTLDTGRCFEAAGEKFLGFGAPLQPFLERCEQVARERICAPEAGLEMPDPGEGEPQSRRRMRERAAG